jgi:RNA polymerase sigma factor (sigma-70 family)
MSDDTTQGSISACFDQLAAGDDQALRLVWERYFDGLLAVARKQLGDAPRRSFDEEDVALSVFECLRKGSEQGRFVEMRDRTDLWKLLVTITKQKVIDRIRRETAQKRGGGATRGESAWGDRGDSDAGIKNAMEHQPTPDDLLALEEQNQQLLSELRDDSLRQIAVLRMHGYTNREIADQLGVTSRTVERKLNLIRNAWRRHLET